jgi:NAD(P)-dependent dehydrogenase (short-subunit alcohol dehydrogenase family)
MSAPAGKTALIIGASRGLGYALAAEYLARGWQVTATVRGAGRTGLMRSFAARHADDPRTLLLMAPGWVQTDLGGPAAPLTIGQSIPGVVDTVEAQAGQGGLQYLDYQGRTIRW